MSKNLLQLPKTYVGNSQEPSVALLCGGTTGAADLSFRTVLRRTVGQSFASVVELAERGSNQ